MRRTVYRVIANEPTMMILVGLFLGVATGYGAIACRVGIDAIRRLAFGATGDITDLAADPTTPALVVLLLPAIGGAIIAPMVKYWASEARGHGVPEVMDAIARKGGRIRPRVAIVKALASVITIGTGGAVGWEGPIIQIGAGIGSTAGQVLHVARRNMRVLVACGAAAGIAATFSAPIAGVLFALEVFLGDLAIVTFTPVVVAAVAGAAVTFHHYGSHAVFHLPEQVYRLQSVWEIPLYALLGVTCACAAVLFTRLVYAFEDAIDAAPGPSLLKPVLGGLAVGAIGLAMPNALGVGYHVMSHAFQSHFALSMLCALFFAKLMAACLTLGSGGSGGIFAPSLFIGAMLGAGYGDVVNRILPAATQTPGVYAVVGMAACVAGTTHAPISAILILFEMTTDYNIILPLMIACIISTAVARGIFRESIYTLKLARRGVRLRGGRDAGILRGITVEETMRDDVVPIPQGTPFVEVRRRALTSDHQVFPVIDDDSRFIGILPFVALRPVLFEEGLIDVAVARDLTIECEHTLAPLDDLQTARETFTHAALEELPVVDPVSGKVVGVLREHDVHVAYNRAASTLE